MLQSFRRPPPILENYGVTPCDGAWSIILPEATTNLITNPSFERSTSAGWATTNTLAPTRSSAYAMLGVYSLALTPAAAGSPTNLIYTNTVTFAAGQTYTFSAWLRAQAGLRFAVAICDSSNTVIMQREFRATGRWQRESITYTEPTGAARRPALIKLDTVSTATFYADAMQLEAQRYPTTYCDGDQAGFVAGHYRWTGEAHASTSTRDAQCRAGGKEMRLAALGFTVLAIAGLTMPAYAVSGQAYALAGGGEYRRSIPPPRVVSLAGRFDAASRIARDRDVRALAEALSPTLVSPPQPALLRYQPLDGVTPVGAIGEIAAVYTGGLEGVRSQPLQMTATITLTMYQPFVARVGGGSTALTYQQTPTLDFIAQRSTGAVWGALGTGANGSVRAIAVSTDSTLYAGGSFTSMGGVANTAYIAAWTGSAWSPLGTGANGAVRALATDARARVYAGGAFTSMGGALNTSHIALWDPSSAAWSALSTGANGDVLALAIGPDGTLYAGGAFTSIGGVAANRIARWNGTNWTAMGTGANDGVYAIAVGLDGTIYAGGLFTQMGGVADTAYIAQWDGSAWTPLGSGMDLNVLALAVGADGTLYAGGDFTTAGGVTVNAVARWNGTGWAQLASGLDAQVRSLAVGPDGTLYAGGEFATTSNGAIAFIDGFARWNGSTWLPGDVDLPGAPSVNAIAVRGDGQLTVGYDHSGAATTPGVTTIDNAGTQTELTVRISGPGTLYQLANVTTGQAVYFNALALQRGETLTIVTGPAPSVTSDWRGQLLGFVLPGSALTSLLLQPGANTIELFLDNATGNTSATLAWPVRFEGIEGVTDGE